jgi:hypothetical protein
MFELGTEKTKQRREEVRKQPKNGATSSRNETRSSIYDLLLANVQFSVLSIFS